MHYRYRFRQTPGLPDQSEQLSQSCKPFVISVYYCVTLPPAQMWEVERCDGGQTCICRRPRESGKIGHAFHRATRWSSVSQTRIIFMSSRPERSGEPGSGAGSWITARAASGVTRIGFMESVVGRRLVVWRTITVRARERQGPGRVPQSAPRSPICDGSDSFGATSNLHRVECPGQGL